jgi:tetratricopeptide (TPR) repeat protein
MSADPRGYAATGLLFFALVAAFVVRRFETEGRGDRVALALTGAAVVGLGAAAALPRGTVGLATAAIVVAPFTWGALVLLGRRWLPESRAPLAFLLSAAVISWALGGARVGSRESQWGEVASLSPGWAEAHHARIALAEASGSTQEIESRGEACHRVLPEDGLCARIVAVKAERAGDCARAIDAARVGLRARPRDGALLALSARCVRRGSRSDDEALALARSALEQSPTDEGARVALATVLSRRGAHAEAARVLREGPGVRGAEGLLLLGQSALAAEQEPVAREALERLIAREPGHAEGQYLLAAIEHRAGRFNRAREGYLRALAADRGHFFARYNLARLLLSAGVLQESLHHAQRLLEQSARDPRVRELARDIQRQIVAATNPNDAGAPVRVE